MTTIHSYASSRTRPHHALAAFAIALSAAFISTTVNADDTGSSGRFRFADRFSTLDDLALRDADSAQAPSGAVQGVSDSVARNTTSARPDGPATERRREWEAEMETRKSYVLPPLEIVGFDFLLNRYNLAINGKGSEYNVNARSFRRNLNSRWAVDSDPFSINQFLHPYQGSMYYGFARSAGLNYWESLGYTFAGSAFWEYFGETTLPSKNDQIASGIGGTFLGEALYRMANLVLERGDRWPQWAHEVAATAISPSMGFNRLAFGERFKPIFPSHDADYYSRLQLGVTGTTQSDPGFAQKLKRNEGVIDFSLDYGLPGKPDYAYRRPFDYFTFQLTAASGNGLENIMTKGLLLGRDYKVGDRYRGIFGLYGSYDYFAPQLFRVSSTALSLGTTGQVWLTDTIAMQGTALLGIGYAAVGTLHGTSETDYHYGTAPQALVALRLIFGENYSFDVTGREYFVSRVGSGDSNNHDNIVRLESALTWRISGPHAVALKYVLSRRDSSYSGVDHNTQSRGTIGLFYTLLGHDRFGAAEWRK